MSTKFPSGFCSSCFVASISRCCLVRSSVRGSRLSVDSYLLRNIRLNGCENVTAIKADALEFYGEYDIVVSNPPYVRFDERNTLSKEVLAEPETALFADDNGLCYYKKITENMKDSCLALIFEIGETQGGEVSEIMRSHGFHHIKTIKDLCGFDRVVLGFSQKYTVK